MSFIETRATLGDRFVKGLNAKLLDIQNQADLAYSLAYPSALGVEENTYTSLFKEISSDQARETVASKTGVGYAALTAEGSDYNSDSRVAGYQTQFNPIKKTNSVTITEENRADGIVSSKLSEMKDLLIGMKQTINKDTFSIFNYAFTAQASLPAHLTYYGDGTPMCSVIHPIKASTTSNTTQSNASAVGLPMTEINLETARTALRRQTDDKDLPMSIGSGRLVLLVPDSLEKAAVINTKSTQRANTANNDMNIYYDGLMTVISTKWINSQNGGSDTQWFVMDSMNSPLRFLNRESLKTSVYVIDSNKNVVTDIKTRYQIGNVDFRGCWGSLGAGAAYAA